MDRKTLLKRCKEIQDKNAESYFDEEGRWITTENDNHVHLNEKGSPDKGNPHVIAAMTGKKSGNSQKSKSGNRSGGSENKGANSIQSKTSQIHTILDRWDEPGESLVDLEEEAKLWAAGLEEGDSVTIKSGSFVKEKDGRFRHQGGKHYAFTAPEFAELLLNNVTHDLISETKEEAYPKIGNVREK